MMKHREEGSRSHCIEHYFGNLVQARSLFCLLFGGRVRREKEKKEEKITEEVIYKWNLKVGEIYLS